ncbi:MULTISPECIES: alpha/beta fold hydrolase [Nonomuraea]|uniref:Alpha/beta hydrolase n=1 Tax=Nonomuraea ferruginea TaxID=46174 RepID=A0ABT4T0D0_9ACTN|nr:MULTISPECIES: alpha/beta hydrolase [Nonomuraea]MDA0642575.1 alpha/beta hydrolase [Nonomuraea ferruginea]TXK34254.1 alpha/beta hydrolase [Nonomuraea sp. C10]
MGRDEKPGNNDVPTPVLIDLGDHALCAQVRGKGPTVVLECGGSGQGVGTWGEELELALAERVTVVTYDRAGVGRSGGSQARTVTEMADDLRRLLRALHLELPAVFVGWSYGGLVTQLYAARHPTDVAGLVFVDPTASGTPPGSALVRALSFLLAPRLLRLRAMFGGTDARSLRELADTLAGMQNAMNEAAQARQESGLPPVPIRVITAGKRPRMPKAHLEHLNADHRALASQSPHGQVMVAERASHQIPFEQPEIIIQAVDEVLGCRRHHRKA